MRQKLLLVLLVIVATGALAFRFVLMQHEPAVVPSVASAQLIREFQAVLDAEKITDPYQRCLAYPDLPGTSWDKSIVAAYCGLMLRKAVSLEEIDAALKRGETELLEQTFDGYLQRNYEPGQHGFLTWAIIHIFDHGGTFDVADRWVKADPNSAFALTARATAYIVLAVEARGEKSARDTPKENFRRMEELCEKALVDLNEAARRSHRLITAYNQMFEIAQLTGDTDLRVQAARRALALDPADQWTYDNWANAVEPKWGGSIAEMNDLVDHAMKHAGDNPLLKRMPARVYCAEANTLEVCHSCGEIPDRAKKALPIYLQGAAIAPAACVFDEAGNTAERAGDYEAAVRIDSQSFRFSLRPNEVYRRALALRRLGQHDLAVQSLDALRRAYPRYAMVDVWEGWIDQEDHRPHEAEKAFLAATQIDRDNREANTELVNLYTTSLDEFEKAKTIVDRLMSENPNNPRAWILSAVLDHGKDEKHCKMALEKYLALVDHTHADSYEQRDIDRATARVAELTRLEQKATVPATAK